MNDTETLGDTIVVSPVAKRITLEPGKSYTSTIRITNPSGATKSIHCKINKRPYSVIGEEYNADLAKITAYNNILDWIEIDETEGEVEPNGTKEVTYTIHVPEDAKSGGQYGAITVEQVPDANENTTITSVMEISSLIYSQIGSPVYEGEILDNQIPAVSFVNPVDTLYSVKNTGNVHQDVRVTIKASHAITGEPILIDSNLNSDDLTDSEIADNGTSEFSELIMPETTRTAKHSIAGLPSLGIYRITQEIHFDGKTDTKEQVTFVCPIWFILLVIVAISAIIAMIVTAIKKKKKTKKQPINKKAQE